MRSMSANENVPLGKLAESEILQWHFSLMPIQRNRKTD
ncbi:hypothetical protein Plim_2192 [Planctopirus limnophila DSM 3776]|uniref:Uncharacterized protein n=1 Tax=Planctopirus limnophila (strain ATCC 43296 / DSM 3776 / IFAM 1008 / Mu 290) TaxID=521674 RepID=D5SMW3_PLAL2|nr:hypothetical protein Plim_2192 [Planctopirus limnophila DSM 3776]